MVDVESQEKVGSLSESFLKYGFETRKRIAPSVKITDGPSRLYDGSVRYLAENGSARNTAAIQCPNTNGLNAREASRVALAYYNLCHEAGIKPELPFDKAKSDRFIASPKPAPITWDDREGNAGQIQEWLVKGLFPRRGVSLLWGQSGSGKSFVSLELAACIATGRPFFGQRTKAIGGVLFALGEGAGTMPTRLDAMRVGRFAGEAPMNVATGLAMDLDRLPIAWMPVGELSKPAPFAAFAARVRTAAARMISRHDCPLRIIIVDTVVASFGFPEDPDATAVTTAMKALDALAQELDVLVVAIHHAGKSKAAGEHGSYAWRGSAETSIEVDATRQEGLGNVTERRLWVRKNRHGAEGWNRPFNLEPVQLGFDEDGDAIESAVIVPVEPSAAGTLTCGGGATVGEARALRALTAALATSGTPIVAPDGSTVHAARTAVVRASYAPDDPGRPDAISRRFRRDLDHALTAGTIGRDTVDGEAWIWATASNDNEPAGAPLASPAEDA